MSRTDKDRPYWVAANDPLVARSPYHKHFAIRTKLIGEEPVYRRDLDGREYLAWMQGLYARWSEVIDCTIDHPMRSKHAQTCGFVLDRRNLYAGYSTKEYRNREHRKLRHLVRQRLRWADYDNFIAPCLSCNFKCCQY